MAIIGLSGAQGVGKTTLLNALRSVKMFKQYNYCDEVTRWVHSIGLDINELGNDATQYLISMRHIYNLEMYGNCLITDRTILDCLVYTRYLHEQGQVSQQCLNDVTRVFNRIQNRYTHIFYIKPEFDIENDGVRSTSTEFRDRISELFEQAIFEDMNREPTVLTGPVEHRVDQIISEVLHDIRLN